MIKQLSAEVELRQNWEKSTRQQHHDMVKHLGWNFIEEEDEETWRGNYPIEFCLCLKIIMYRASRTTQEKSEGIPTEAGRYEEKRNCF